MSPPRTRDRPCSVTKAPSEVGRKLQDANCGSCEAILDSAFSLSDAEDDASGQHPAPPYTLRCGVCETPLLGDGKNGRHRGRFLRPEGTGLRNYDCM